MKFSDSLRLAFSNLRKRKGRTFLTSLAVAIGTMLVVTMVGLGTTGEKYVTDEISKHSSVKKIQVNPFKNMSEEEMDEQMAKEDDIEDFFEKNFNKIDKDKLKKFKNIKGVDHLTASVFAQVSEAQIDNRSIRDVSLIGYDLDYSVFSKDEVKALKLKDKKFKTLVAGRELSKGSKNEILISQSCLKKLGITDPKSAINKEIILTVNQSTQGIKLKPIKENLKIVGVINEKMEEYSGDLVTSLDIPVKFKGYENLDKDIMKNKGFDSVYVFPNTLEDVKKVTNSIKNMDYQAMSYMDVVEKIHGVFKVLKSILASLGIIVLFVASLGIINTMIMSIYERVKSIGIMKSLGASRSDIKNVFIMESGAIGFIGGMLGIGFSLMNSKIIEICLKTYLKLDNPIKFYLPSWLTWGALVFSILLAILSGLYPSSKAAKLDPIECLNSK